MFGLLTILDSLP